MNFEEISKKNIGRDAPDSLKEPFEKGIKQTRDKWLGKKVFSESSSAFESIYADVVEPLGDEIGNFLDNYGATVEKRVNKDDFYFYKEEDPRAAASYITGLDIFALHQRFFYRPKSDVISDLTHEMIHKYSYQSFRYDGKKERVVLRKIGIELRDLRDENLSYQWLNEAVTEWLTKEFLDQKGIEFFRKHLGAVPEESVISKMAKVASLGTAKHDGYITEQIAFDNLAILISLQQGVPKKDVKEMFARAALTGNLFPLARNLDRVFGPEGLRRLGSYKPSYLEEFIKSLRYRLQGQ